MTGKAFVAWCAVASVVLATAIVLIAVAVERAADRQCHGLGGHRVSTGRGHLCISSDGRVIEP